MNNFKRGPIVAKFGGTSVSKKSNIETIVKIVKRELEKNPVLVVSALSGVTDLLVSIAHQNDTSDEIKKIKEIHRELILKIWEDKLSRERLLAYIDERLVEVKKLAGKKITKAISDAIISYGEIMSSFLIAESLKKSGVEAKQIIASDIIVTDNNFGSAEFLVNETKNKIQKNIEPLIKKGIVPVITGFIGSTVKGQVTTLGRGGSDYSASIIGYCLGAREVQIWTDVDGIFTADPRLIKKARVLPQISYKEASEIAFFGAKVLHPRTIRPAVKAGIPVRILNTFNPDNYGTEIVDKPFKTYPISAVTFKRNITLVNMYSTSMLLSRGFLVSLFNIFKKHNISIDLVSVSEVSVSVTLDNDENLKEAVEELKKITSVVVSKDVSVIALVGEGITNSSKTIRDIFDLLDKEKILVRMISLGATDINVSLVISTENLERAVKILHNRLLLKKLVK